MCRFQKCLYLILRMLPRRVTGFAEKSSSPLIFDCYFSQSGNLYLSLFSVLRSDCIKLDLKEISYLVLLCNTFFCLGLWVTKGHLHLHAGLFTCYLTVGNIKKNQMVYINVLGITDIQLGSPR